MIGVWILLATIISLAFLIPAIGYENTEQEEPSFSNKQRQ